MDIWQGPKHASLCKPRTKRCFIQYLDKTAQRTVSNTEAAHQRRPVKKGILETFAKFTGKHLCKSLFFNKETLAQVFFCEFCEFSRTPFLQNTSGRLLLAIPWISSSNQDLKLHTFFFSKFWFLLLNLIPQVSIP